MARDYYYYDRARDARGTDSLNWTEHKALAHMIRKSLLLREFEARGWIPTPIKSVVRYEPAKVVAAVRELTGEKLLSAIT